MEKKQANINIRVNPEVKAEAEAACKELGMSMSGSINMFLKKLIRDKTDPFGDSDLKIDPDVKAKAEAICNELGLSLTSAITIFLKKLIREERIPFEVSLKAENQSNTDKNFSTTRIQDDEFECQDEDLPF